MIRAIPNLLTVGRGLAGPAVIVLVLGLHAPFVAFWVFLGAILTDLVDGTLARWLRAESQLGRLLDPLSDKALIAATWLTVGLAGWAPWWLAGTMLARDLAVGLGWLGLGRPTPRATMTGRLKVSFEGVALPILLFRQEWLGVHWPSVGLVLGVFALLLAIASALLHLHEVLQATNPGGSSKRAGVGARP
ncbi:MAG: CDP-alcohol phosphatidyltransferase family protein [Deltaproteobacteria bacterium]|nr:MAG: CDP-alcohol phosphatidyltransferase family protein [Deltaproteobacteria bacterium]